MTLTRKPELLAYLLYPPNPNEQTFRTNRPCMLFQHQSQDTSSTPTRLGYFYHRSFPHKVKLYTFTASRNRHVKVAKGLTRLPPKAKMIVCGQLIPVLCYGCEAFTKPNEEMARLGRQWARWVVGAWAGSSAERVEILSGVED